MKKEKIKTITIIFLLFIIVLFIGIICGMLLDKKTTDDDVVETSNDLTKEEVLTSLVGEWGMCHKEYGCNGIIIGKDEDGSYYYSPYVMWSEGGDKGTIKSIERINSNKYKLTIYFPGYENEMGSSPEQTIDYTVDISEISSEILYVESIKYQLIIGDREAFFNSIKP